MEEDRGGRSVVVGSWGVQLGGRFVDWCPGQAVCGPGVPAIGFLKGNEVQFAWVQLSVKDGRLSCEALWRVDVGLVCRPSFPDGGLWAGLVVCWASKGTGLFEGGEIRPVGVRKEFHPG